MAETLEDKLAKIERGEREVLKMLQASGHQTAPPTTPKHAQPENTRLPRCPSSLRDDKLA